MPRVYIPTNNNLDGALNHREDFEKVFEHDVEMHNQEVINNIFLHAKDIYCLTEELRGSLGDKTVEEIRSYAKSIAAKFNKLTSERLPDSYWYPDLHYMER